MRRPSGTLWSRPGWIWTTTTTTFMRASMRPTWRGPGRRWQTVLLGCGAVKEGAGRGGGGGHEAAACGRGKAGHRKRDHL